MLKNSHVFLENKTICTCIANPIRINIQTLQNTICSTKPVAVLAYFTTQPIALDARTAGTFFNTKILADRQRFCIPIKRGIQSRWNFIWLCVGGARSPSIKAMYHTCRRYGKFRTILCPQPILKLKRQPEGALRCGSGKILCEKGPVFPHRKHRVVFCCRVCGRWRRRDVGFVETCAF